MCLVANYRVALDHLRLYTPKIHLAVRQAAFHSLPSEHPRQRLLKSGEKDKPGYLRPEVDWSSKVLSMPYNVFSVNIRLY